ncbi:MAG TPA: EAL domain-containing protein [Terracidiphilus sp.]|nr:EAL domain-containing protein [Terracidiphilus sp.]
MLEITQDILARLDNDEVLRESEEFLRLSQEAARIGSYVSWLDRDEWRCTEVMTRLLGLEPKASYVIAEWAGAVHPEDLAEVRRYFEEEVRGKGQPFDREYRIVRKSDGAVRWVHGLGQLEFDASGQPVVMRGTIQDVTERKRAEAELTANRELLRVFVQHAPAALAMFDREMRYLAVSRRWVEDYGLQGQSVIGRSHYEMAPDIPKQWKEAHRRGMAGEAMRSDADLFERADGSRQWIRWELLPWRMSTGQVGGIVLFADNITSLKTKDEKLNLAAEVFAQASEGIFITDATGSILEVNDAFTRITGYSREEIVGQNPRILNSGRQSREFYKEMWRTLNETGHWSGEIWNRAKDGHLFAEMLSINAVQDEEGRLRHYVALFADITVAKEQERRLQLAVHYDLLTGLPNRVLLADRMHQAMARSNRRGRPLALACLDLDNFREINEKHGHEVGDKLLQALTARIKSVLREDDTLARLGGDEFALMLTDLDGAADSSAVLDRVLGRLAEPVQLGELRLVVSASLGVTVYPQPGDVDGDQLLRQADQAMYQAKVEGKDRLHVFDPREDRSVRGHHEDIGRIRRALDDEEFELYYQPKVNMNTGAVVGAEALLRWRHPQAGVLPPAQFLPVVEGHPLAVEIGEWVIETALAQMESWREEGLEIPVSVNLDAQHLQSSDFVNRLAKILKRFPKTPASSLELEVLETSALGDVVLVSELMRSCARMGVSFALDDFGTGYSSLSYLKRLPVDVLKIDRSFVHDMLDNPEYLTMLEGVLGLASAFRRRTVAEGVETVEHGLMLLRLGCQHAQGYGIARPMPAGELPQWVKSWQAPREWTQARAVAPEHWPALHAGVEHRAWIQEIEEFLRGQRQSAPVQAAEECGFGSWLKGALRNGHAGDATLKELDRLHAQMHGAAGRLMERAHEEPPSAAPEDLDELRTLRDDLLARLGTLVETL